VEKLGMDGDLGEELADIGRREPVVSNDAPVRGKLKLGQTTRIAGFKDNCAVSQGMAMHLFYKKAQEVSFDVSFCI
jgi:hypothetical protein